MTKQAQLSGGGRESFANILRGIASLSVLVAHYIGVFSYIRGQYAGFSALETEPFPFWGDITFHIPNFNYGPLGVALFFLVSGFVISLLVARLSAFENWRVGFLIGRIFRIWPTYWIGLSITVFSFCIAARLNAIPCPVVFLDVLHQAITLENLVGDGVVWTLGVEVRFYILAH